MIVFLDTEFSGLHQDTTLISIALLCYKPGDPRINGRCFYAELIDYDPEQETPWLTENVIDNLLLGHLQLSGDDDYVSETKTSEYAEFGDKYSEFGRGTAEGVSQALKAWFQQFWAECGPGGITIVADVLAYDWMLFNTLLADYEAGYPQLPAVINYLPLDFSTMLAMYGVDPDVSRAHFCGPANLDDFDTLLVPMPLMGAQHNSLADAVQLRQGFIRLAAQMANSRAIPNGDVYRFGRHNLENAVAQVKKRSQTNAIWLLSMNELSLMNNVVDMAMQPSKMQYTAFPAMTEAQVLERQQSAMERRPLDSHLVYQGIKFWLCVVPDLRDHDLYSWRKEGSAQPEERTFGDGLSLVHEYLDAPVRLPSDFGQLYCSGHIQLLKTEEVNTLAADLNPGMILSGWQYNLTEIEEYARTMGNGEITAGEIINIHQTTGAWPDLLPGPEKLVKPLIHP